MNNILLSRMNSNNFSVGIFGLGYVGLPLALRFTDVGVKVFGFEVDKLKVDTLNAGKSYISYIEDAAIAKCLDQGFVATTVFSRVVEVDVLILCLPTPLNKYREPDMNFVLNCTDKLLPYLRYDQLIALESTTYPCFTDEVLKPRIESKGLRVGTDVFLVFSPERVDPGSFYYDIQSIPKIVGGCTLACLEVGVSLYSMIVDQVFPVSTTKVAEMIKLLENIHRAVNIGLVNEMKIVADAMGIDINEVIRAASSKPFGFVPYYPGPGVGGHCISVDPFFLTWKAKEYGVNTRFIELAGDINSNMPNWVAGKLADALHVRNKSIKGSQIMVLGISYKKNIDDARESPSLKLLELLHAKGAHVDYSDPWIPMYPVSHEYPLDLKSVELTPEIISSYDAVLLTTNHDCFDYNMIQQNAKLIVDTRGVYLNPFVNIVRA